MISASFLVGASLIFPEKIHVAMFWAFIGLIGLISSLTLKAVMVTDSFLILCTVFGKMKFDVNEISQETEIIPFLRVSILQKEIYLVSIIFFFFLTPGLRAVYLGPIFMRKIENGNYIGRCN